jgi:hypothetical protein
MTAEPAPPPDVWLDERLIVGPSSIDGRGLFFAEDLAAGTVVVRLGGELVSSDELASRLAAAMSDPHAPPVDSVSAYGDLQLVLPADTPAHFGNHSCDPTLWFDDGFVLATRRAVGAGEEATVDYGTISGADGFRLACRCGTVECRGEVTSADWTRPDLRERYGGHWVPALQQRIDRDADRVECR